MRAGRIGRVGALLAGIVVASAGLAAEADVEVVKRGTATLMQSEIDARLDEVPTTQRAGLMDSPERIDAVLSQLLLLEQLAAEAIDEGLESDPRLARQLALVRNRLLAQFKLEKIREAAARQVDGEALARERYAANPQAFKNEEIRAVRHLLVSTEDRSDADALALAEKAQARIAAGESLADLARELSDDKGSRESGGLIENIPRGRTDPAFEDATFALANPGDITPAPVKSRFGYHLIELVSVTPESVKPYAEVREALVAEVTAAAIDRIVKNHVDNLGSLPIEAEPARIEALRTRYGVREALPADAPANAPGQANATPR